MPSTVPFNHYVEAGLYHRFAKAAPHPGRDLSHLDRQTGATTLSEPAHDILFRHTMQNQSVCPNRLKRGPFAGHKAPYDCFEHSDLLKVPRGRPHVTTRGADCVNSRHTQPTRPPLLVRGARGLVTDGGM